MSITETLIDFKDFLKGKKTFICGALMIILGWMNNDGEMVMEGIAFITLRAGISR